MSNLNFAGLMEADGVHAATFEALARQNAQTNRNTTDYKQRLLEAQTYLNNLRTRQTRIPLREAMSTSDFPNLFGDILSRRLAADYMVYSADWTAYAERRMVPDFRNVKTFAVYGGDQLLTEAPEGTTGVGYKAVEDRELTDYAVKKYVSKIQLTMEALVNDDLGAFDRLPTKLAAGARRSEEKFVTELYAGTSGPLAAVYSATNNNVVTSNPTLSISALQTAYAVLKNQTDENGLPIFIDAVTLVVPPALEITARNILNATQLQVGLVGQGDDAAPAEEQRIVTANWMANRTTLVVNPWLPYIADTNGDTSWYLFASPTSGRPAIEVGFLSLLGGAPVIFRRRPDAVSLTGNTEIPIGSFDSNAYEWGVMHVFGGKLADYRCTVASNGTGS
jgi:hypothetical protein